MNDLSAPSHHHMTSSSSNHDHIDEDESSLTEEAALLREAAQLLATVETDRSHLEVKLQDTSNHAAEAIHKLHKQLHESEDRYKQLKASSEASLHPLEEKIRDLEDHLSIAVREKDVLSELNHSLLDKNKSLKTRDNNSTGNCHIYYRLPSKNGSSSSHSLIGKQDVVNDQASSINNMPEQHDSLSTSSQPIVHVIDADHSNVELLLLRKSHHALTQQLLDNDSILKTKESNMRMMHDEWVSCQDRLAAAEKHLFIAERAASLMTNIAVSTERNAAYEKNNLSIRVAELEQEVTSYRYTPTSTSASSKSPSKSSLSLSPSKSSTPTRAHHQQLQLQQQVDKLTQDLIMSQQENQRLQQDVSMLTVRMKAVTDENDAIIAKEVSNLALWSDRIQAFEFNINSMSDELHSRINLIDELEYRIQYMSESYDAVKQHEAELIEELMALHDANGQHKLDDRYEMSDYDLLMDMKKDVDKQLKDMQYTLQLQHDIEAELKSRIVLLELAAKIWKEEKQQCDDRWSMYKKKLADEATNHQVLISSQQEQHLRELSSAQATISQLQQHIATLQESLATASSTATRSDGVDDKDNHDAEDYHSTIISLQEQVASLSAELSSLREYQQQRLCHETEARNMILDQDKDKDADYLLQELINTKVNYAMLGDDHVKSKNIIAGLRRQLQESLSNEAPSFDTTVQTRERATTQMSSTGSRSRSISSANNKDKTFQQHAKDLTSAAGNMLRLFDDDVAVATPKSAGGRKPSLK